MPKETFEKLSQQKRQRFLNEALKEFAMHNYSSASINRIVKNLGIARGSVYQYFEDKLDLWLYLKDYAEEVKMGYITSVDRNAYPDFWSYYRALYAHGMNFDLEKPECSKFLYRVGFKENSEEVSQYIHTWKTRAINLFSQWIEKEKALGTFTRDISTPVMAHFMITLSQSVAELLQEQYQVDFDRNMDAGKPLFADKKDELEAAVSELVLLMKKSLT